MNQPSTQPELKALAVNRATITDGDKVRYRVYTSPTEFIAVIAENALMAVKAAGVAEPHRIVRDLPTEGVSLKAEKLARQEAAERVMLSIVPPEPKATIMTEIAPVSPLADDFIPLHLRDLERRTSDNRSILTLRDIFGDGLATRPKPSPAPARVLPPEPSATLEPETPKKAESEPEVESKELSPEEVAALLAAEQNK